MSAADPNHWVQDPPSTFVKVQGTSRETVNGQLGLVLQFTNGRYTVLLCQSQDVVSLKPDNLIVCNMLEKAKAYYQMFQNNPDVRRQIQTISQQVQLRTGLRPQVFLGVLLVLIVACWYFFGFSKLLMVVAVTMMGLTVVGPDLVAGKEWNVIVRNAPMRWRTVVRTQIPVVGERIASNDLLLNGLTALLAIFIVYSLVASPTAAAKSAAAVPESFVDSTTGSSSSSRTLMTAEMQQKYYKLGFDDAVANKEFGASLPAAAEPEPTVVGVKDDDMAWRNMDISSTNTYYPPPPMHPKKKSPWTLSTGLAALALFRTVSELGRGPDGQFHFSLMRANFGTLPAWKLGMLGFSIYRIVSAFLF